MPEAVAQTITQAIRGLPESLQPPVERWLERLCEQHADAASNLEGSSIDAAAMVHLVAVSEFAGRVLLRHWPWFVGAAADDSPDRPPQPAEPRLAGITDEAEFKKALRDSRNRSMLRILWRDLGGDASLSETLESLSTLADDLITASSTFAASRLAEQSGVVRDADGGEVRLVVLAMGKLGGRELNFSSDVDLVFLYARDGESDGRRSMPAQEYFARQARRIVDLLEDATADGFVYRVDTRLRPFGDSGPPVVSFAALESYLLNHGRNWERYAYIKSRVILPGPRDRAADSLRSELIEPFVYRQYLDFGVFESLREMKALITAEVERREMAQNIKLGPGGIREIEFIVQSLQLVRGGSMRRLRSRRLLVALRELMQSRGLSRSVAEGLLASYTFLRRLENFLQALRDQQTHELPTDERDRARLALAMGYPDWKMLDRETDRHRRYVADQFARVAFRSDGDDEASDLVTAIAARCDVGADQDSWQRLFEEFGYADAGAMAHEISSFLETRAIRQIETTARRRLLRLLPAMLRLLQERPSPARTLRRLLGIVAQVLRRSAYVALLNENAAVLERLVDLCERSAYLADEVARFPLLLDEMLDPRLYTAELTAESLREDLVQRLDSLGETDSERRVELVGQFQRATMFRIAAADFSGEMPVMKVSDRLTDLAEIVLQEALDIAWRDLVQRHGEPAFREGDERRTAGMGVIAYGKLGGIELSYGSDLDVVFLHNSRGSEQQTNGARVVDNSTFFARLAQRLVHFLTTQTGSGQLYEVDTRLRPSGRSGLLVSSIEAFDRYQRENAWTWEHQALLRARAVAGAAAVARDFGQIRAMTLATRVNRESLRDDVREMREKMRARLDCSDDRYFDLKQGRGGIGDIEFLVQYLVLRNAAQHPAVFHYSDNIRQLGALGAAGCIDREQAGRLQDIYRAYRVRLHHLLLDERPPRLHAGEFRAERDSVLSMWTTHIG